MAGWLGGIGEALEDRNFRNYSLGSILSWISYRSDNSFSEVCARATLSLNLESSKERVAKPPQDLLARNGIAKAIAPT